MADWEDSGVNAWEDAPVQEPSFFDKSAAYARRANAAMQGLVEPLIQAGTGMVAKPISEVSGLAATGYEAATGGENAAMIPQFQQDVQQSLTYQPRTEFATSQYNPVTQGLRVLGTIFSLPSDLVEYGLKKADAPEWAVSGGKEAVNQALALAGTPGSGKIVGKPNKTLIQALATEPVQAKLQSAMAAIKQKQMENAIADSIRIKGAEVGLLSPPERGLKSAISHMKSVDDILSAKNKTRITELLSDEVGLPKGSVSETAVATKAKQLSNVYGAVEKSLPSGVEVTPTFNSELKNITDKMSKLYKEDPEIFSGYKGAIDLVESQQQPAIATKAGQAIYKNMPIDVVMSKIKQLRETARLIDKKLEPTGNEIKIAESSRGLANLYEDALAQTLKDSGKQALYDSFTNAREQLSKLHMLDAAREVGGKIDPRKFATIAGRYGNQQKFLTGNFKTVADFVRTFEKQTRNVDASAVNYLPTRYETMVASMGAGASFANPSAIPYALFTGLPAGMRVAGNVAAAKGMLQQMPSYELSLPRRAGIGAAGMLGNVPGAAIPYMTQGYYPMQENMMEGQ